MPEGPEIRRAADNLEVAIKANQLTHNPVIRFL